MGPGIRATVAFDDAGVCPIVELSSSADATVGSVSTSVTTASPGKSVTEFSMDAEGDPDGDIEHVISYGTDQRYRLPHEAPDTCPCERLGHHGCPVERYFAADGKLTITFHATDYDQLQTVVADLRERFPEMDIKRFLRAPAESHGEQGVFVDRGQLTTRQRDVLETAFEMGYFERPRDATASEVADELEITPSTFSEHLAAAQRKLFADVLERE